MRMTAKEFAIKNNMPLATVKRYCQKGIFRCHRIGRKYSIDVNYALKALDRLDDEQQILNQTVKPVPRRHIGRINTTEEFLQTLKDMRRGIA